MTKSKELAVKQEAGLPAELSGDWGAASDDIEVDDLAIPRILLMAKTSGMLDTIKGAHAGEYRENITGRLMGNDETPMRLCIFSYYKDWRITKKGSGDLIAIEPYTPQNCDRPLEEDNGERIISLCHNYHCLSLDDPAESAFPYLFTLQRTSSGAARRLNTLFMQMKKARKPSALQVVEFTSVLVKAENSYWKSDFKIGGDTPVEYLRVAKEWSDKIRSGAVKVRVAEAEEVHSAQQTSMDPVDPMVSF